MMTAHGTINSAIEAMKLGAIDYLQKPFEVEELLVVVTRALDDQRLRTHHRYLLSEQDELFSHYGIVGRSRGMQDVIQTAGWWRPPRARRSSRARPGRARSSSPGRFTIAARSATCRREVNCGRDSREPAGVGAVRLRARRVHGRHTARRASSPWRRRVDLPRRDRQP